MKRTLRLALLAALVLAVSACGGEGDGSEEAEASTIPESSLEFEGELLPTGEYVSDEFRPAISFELGEEGWQTGVEHFTGHNHRRIYVHGESVEMHDYLTLSYAPEGNLVGSLDFFVDPTVYKVVSSYEVEEEPTPEDMVTWLQQNPYLTFEEPQPTSVGGVEGVHFTAVPSRVPEEYVTCGHPCVPLFQTSDHNLFFDVGRSEKVQFLVLEDVEGETVTIAIKAGADRFDEFMPRAQDVLETVEWAGA